MRIATLFSPRNVAMGYLARREHSKIELQNKLSLKGFDREVIDQALNKLQKENLQCDSRFAQSYIHYRVTKGMGPIKIRHELKQKGVLINIIQQAERAEECDWFALLKRVAERKYNVIYTNDLKEKQKRIRFLQQRGFLMPDIMSLLGR